MAQYRELNKRRHTAGDLPAEDIEDPKVHSHELVEAQQECAKEKGLQKAPPLFADACLFECAVKKMDMYHPTRGIKTDDVPYNFYDEHEKLHNSRYQIEKMTATLAICAKYHKNANIKCEKALKVYKCFFDTYLSWLSKNAFGVVVCPINATFYDRSSRNKFNYTAETSTQQTIIKTTRQTTINKSKKKNVKSRKG